jgi:hypothetical protein
MEYIDVCLQLSEHNDRVFKLVALAAFSMIEGAVLYSSFAYLKHFQACGKNKLINIVRGVDMSVRDEALHSEAGAWLFRTLLHESNLPQGELDELKTSISNIQQITREHEHKIVDMIFEKGKIEGVTAHQMKNFVDSRIDLCLSNLGYEKVYKPEYNPIAEWFYTSINAYKFNDFFTGIGREYNHSFISEFMMYNKGKVKEMVTKAGCNNTEEFVNLIYNTVDVDCYPADYELYGNFCYKFFPNEFEVRKIDFGFFGREAREKPFWDDNEIKFLIENNKNKPVISFHTWGLN